MKPDEAGEAEGAKVQEVWSKMWDADQADAPAQEAGETYSCLTTCGYGYYTMTCIVFVTAP